MMIRKFMLSRKATKRHNQIQTYEFIRVNSSHSQHEDLSYTKDAEFNT